MDNIKKFEEDFLDRMKGLLDEANKQGHIIVRVEDLENAFPELKENEDERIRKEISKFLKDIHNDSLKNRRFIADRYGDAIPDDMIPTWLAWLEKQKEQNGENEEDNDFIDKACEWLEEQDEMVGISFKEDFIERFKNYMKGE